MTGSSAASNGAGWRAWAWRHRYILAVALAALIVRLHWNLSVHPLGDYLYSDMSGYNRRANAVLGKPFDTHPYTVFFPYGTTWMLAGLKVVFGHENFVAFSIWYALLGTLVVWNSMWITQRVTDAPWVPPLVGGLLTIYYPLISVGGYILSEIPFAACLTGATFLLLRLHQEGRKGDAWAIGVLVGVGMAIRPQMLMSVALFGLYWLVFRKHFPRITWPMLGRVALVLGLFVVGSSARVYWHTGEVGLVSTNGAVNQVFGRCHNKGIYARPTKESPATIRFAPPPLIQLEAHSAMNPDAWIRLDPVFGADPTPIEWMPGFAVDEFGCTRRTCRLPGGEIEYRGYIGDQELQRKLARECVRRSGVLKQVYFGFVHMVQLWGYNSMWPDQADPKPKPEDPLQSWRALAEFWRRLHLALFAIPALLGLLWLARPGTRTNHAIVALQLASLLAIAALYIGGVRFRIPYDPIILILFGLVIEAVVTHLRSRRRDTAQA